MTTLPVQRISSRDNPLVKELRRLSQSNIEYRKRGRFWAEGEHLCSAALLHGVRPLTGVFAESFWPRVAPALANAAQHNVVIPDDLFAELSALESPAGMGFVFELPLVPGLQPGMASVVLERVQDPGNVGAILRSASAFGFKQIIALTGTAALWSAKVLRSGMGAHWSLTLIEAASLGDLAALKLPILVTSSHRGCFLHEALARHELPNPCAWALGHEGQGVSAGLEALASSHLRIAQPGGEESLNVAAAAAICLHASATSVLL